MHMWGCPVSDLVTVALPIIQGTSALVAIWYTWRVRRSQRIRVKRVGTFTNALEEAQAGKTRAELAAFALSLEMHNSKESPIMWPVLIAAQDHVARAMEDSVDAIRRERRKTGAGGG